MHDTIIGTIWVCTDCMLLHANGEYDPDRPADLPEPLSAIGDGYDVTAGLLAEEHADTCTEDDRSEDRCDCEERSFDTSRCEGCGDWHHGERHAMALWRREVSA